MISFIGGILGLFAGVSMLSVIEILYWISLRFYWKFCWRQNRIESMTQKISNAKKTKRILNDVKKILQESSIHGINYIAHGKIMDRILWIICLGFSMFFCFRMIVIVDKKLPNSRVIALEDSNGIDEVILSF